MNDPVLIGVVLAVIVAPLFWLGLERLDRWHAERDWRRPADEARKRAPWLH